MSRYNYKRRKADEVRIADVRLGSDYPVRIQSMTNTSTMDTEGSALQIKEIADAGGEIVRLTTQGEREAANMALIKEAAARLGCHVPLVADVHFNPKAAYRAATTCDKVRINPGNFVDAARTFRHLEYTDEEYAAEQQRIADALLPLLDLCRTHGTAIRLGVNHGSLSDRIMSRYGDTPAGMAESAMEFLRICRREKFDDVVISIKASNTSVMVETVRTLVAAMDAEDMHYPLHLGVTEAGDGEDGRVKSAVGIGTLLAEGIGDTIRVSLSEHPAAEIPVARHLSEYIAAREGHAPIAEPAEVRPGNSRDYADSIEEFPHRYPLVAGVDIPSLPDSWHRADAAEKPRQYAGTLPVALTSSHINAPGEMMSWIDRFVAAGGRNPIILCLNYPDSTEENAIIEASADLGTMLLNGYGSGVMLTIPSLGEKRTADLALGILQGARLRFSKTEYISCPGCGRTLFDLQHTLAKVKSATSHLTGLKIGVMGCIVNGPGEMADADYGYVGAGPGRVSIYKGKTLMEKNIPAEEALDKMIALIKECGDWQDPE